MRDVYVTVLFAAVRQRLFPKNSPKVGIYINYLSGAPEEVRTHDLQIRSLATPNYPADRSSRGKRFQELAVRVDALTFLAG